MADETVLVASSRAAARLLSEAATQLRAIADEESDPDVMDARAAGVDRWLEDQMNLWWADFLYEQINARASWWERLELQRTLETRFLEDKLRGRLLLDTMRRILTKRAAKWPRDDWVILVTAMERLEQFYNKNYGLPQQRS
jgi:hypothetical protein